MTEARQAQRPTRGELIRWAGWFAIVSAVLYALVGLRYLFAFGMPETAIAQLYVLLAFVGQFAVLGYLPMMLLLVPVAVLIPRKGLVISLAVLFAALGLTVLVLDANIFAQYRYHLSRLTVEIFAGSTWVFAAIIFLVIVLFLSMLAGNIWQRILQPKGRPGIWLALTLVLVWFGGQGIHVWGDATAYAPVTGFTRYMPLYFPLKAKRRLAELGWVDPEQVEKQRLLRRASAPDSGQLRYPLAPLACDSRDPLPNILFVLVDALRPDKIGPQYTPRIARFAEENLQFSNHYSGGNSSRMGIFSLFYGLPSTYWQSFYDLQRPPVLMDQLAASNYEIAAFSSVGFGSPAQIDRTVFAAVASAARFTPPNDGGDKNTAVTKAWQEWLASRADTQQAFFSFLYYDPGNFVGEAVIDSASEDEVQRRYASYLRGIAGVDREVATVLDTLDATDSERATLVIIASDHGYEFDELGLGNIGHGSNYGPWQLRSTLLMDWPGKEPRVYSQRSAHQDLPGTLLTELFACTNPITDYSSGGNLFTEEPWEWITAGSYSSHAIIEPDKIIVTYPGGLVELLGPDYRPAPGIQLDAARIEETMLEMRRFYK